MPVSKQNPSVHAGSINENARPSMNETDKMRILCTELRYHAQAQVPRVQYVLGFQATLKYVLEIIGTGNSEGPELARIFLEMIRDVEALEKAKHPTVQPAKFFDPGEIIKD